MSKVVRNLHLQRNKPYPERKPTTNSSNLTQRLLQRAEQRCQFAIVYTTFKKMAKTSRCEDDWLGYVWFNPALKKIGWSSRKVFKTSGPVDRGIRILDDHDRVELAQTTTGWSPVLFHTLDPRALLWLRKHMMLMTYRKIACLGVKDEIDKLLSGLLAGPVGKYPDGDPMWSRTTKALRSLESGLPATCKLRHRSPADLTDDRRALDREWKAHAESRKKQIAALEAYGRRFWTRNRKKDVAANVAAKAVVVAKNAATRKRKRTQAWDGWG